MSVVFIRLFSFSSLSYNIHFKETGVIRLWQGRANGHNMFLFPTKVKEDWLYDMRTQTAKNWISMLDPTFVVSLIRIQRLQSKPTQVHNSAHSRCVIEHHPFWYCQTETLRTTCVYPAMANFVTWNVWVVCPTGGILRMHHGSRWIFILTVLWYSPRLDDDLPIQCVYGADWRAFVVTRGRSGHRSFDASNRNEEIGSLDN
jgi:hypothetical protein